MLIVFHVRIYMCTYRTFEEGRASVGYLTELYYVANQVSDLIYFYKGKIRSRFFTYVPVTTYRRLDVPKFGIFSTA